MKQQKRKGFTLVELLVVIAILAVLATVSIIGYTSFIKKAKISNDMALAKQINDILLADETGNGGKHPGSLGAALKVIGDNGFDVTKLTPTAEGYDYVYDIANNRIALLEGEKVVYSAADLSSGADLWKFVDNKEGEAYNGTSDNSLYFKNSVGAVTLSKLVGVEVAAGSTIESLTIDSTDKASVVIAGEIGTLKVTAPNATIRHYGEAENVEIVSVDPTHSWHEFGTVTGNITIAKGHLVAEKGAVVGTIVVKSEEVTIKAEGGATVNGVAPATGVTLNKANVEGISEDVISSEAVSEETLKLFAGGIGTEKSPYLIATAEQWANINKIDFSKPHYFAQTADITVDTRVNTIAGSYDGRGYSISTSWCYDDMYNFGYLFATISGHIELKNLNVVATDRPVSLFNKLDWGYSYGADIDNINFTATKPLKCNVNNFGLICMNCIYTGNGESAVYNFRNITSDVNFTNEGSCTAFLIGSGPNFGIPTTLNFENCVNNGIITGTTSVGFLYGNAYYFTKKADLAQFRKNITINVMNCKNNGILMSPVSNATVALAPKSDDKVAGCETNWVDWSAKYQSAVGGSFIASNHLENMDVTVYQNGNSFTINTTDKTVNYKLAISVKTIFSTKDGSAWTDKHTEDSAKKAEQRTLTIWYNGLRFMTDLTVDTQNAEVCNPFKAMDKSTAVKEGIITADENVSYNEDGIAIVVKDGTNYVIFDWANDYYINSDVILFVYAYNADGTLVGVKEVK